MKLTILLALTAAVTLAQSRRTFTGVITDSMCVRNHAMMNIPGEDRCVRECVRSNPSSVKYVLFDGKTAYKLSNQSLPEKFAAKKVTVEGKLYEKTGVIKVEAIRPAQ